MEFLRMSKAERHRSGWLGRVKRGELKLKKAAELMQLSYRQAKRVWRRYRQRGDAGLIHRLRGRRSGRSRSLAFKNKTLSRYTKAYGDFGPTLAAEKLAAEGMIIAPETLRRWLLAAGLWQRRR